MVRVQQSSYRRRGALSTLRQDLLLKLPTVILLVLWSLGLIAAGFMFGRLTAGIQQTPATAPAISNPTPDANSMPVSDVPGEDIPNLPRFPGSTRVEFQQATVDDLIATEVEYVMAGALEPVHDFYRTVFADEGWSVADLGIHQGEWTFLVINGRREAHVEIESRGSTVEVEIELTELLPAEP